MEKEEFIKTVLYKEFCDVNKKYFKSIINHIEQCDKHFSLELRTIRMTTLYKKMDDNKHRIDLKIKNIENGIKVPYMFDEMFSMIYPYIPKSITSIKLPLSKINIKDLKDFKNLNTLITDEYIDISDLKKIKRYTNIKTIYAHFNSYCFYKAKGVANTDNRLLYKDIEVIDNRRSNNSLLEIKPSTKNIKEVKDIIKKFNINKLSRIDIINNDIKISIIFDINRTVMNVMCRDYSYINKYYNMLKKINITLDEIVISTEYEEEPNKYKKINYEENDFDKLDKLNEKVKLSIAYNGGFYITQSYEEFRGLVEAIKYYKDLINTYPLSPLEKLTFAYDIMKSFVYNEGKNVYDSRRAYRVIATGNIVCVGYVELLNEILYELDDNITSGDLNVACLDYQEDDYDITLNHVRNIIRIHDDKYDIHGFYFLDATWDSFNPDYYDVYGNDYDALSLYKHFLIPIKEYNEVFQDEIISNLFSGKLGFLNDGDIDEKIIDECIQVLKEEDSKYNNSFKTIIYSNDFNNTFCRDNKNDRELLKEFKSRRISLDEFLTLIRNVRVCEGYSGEILDKEIEKIERINSEFFEDSVEYKLKKR